METVIAYFKAPSHNLLGETDENLIQDSWLLKRPKCEAPVLTTQVHQ
jgi:hypothetical protein